MKKFAGCMLVIFVFMIFLSAAAWADTGVPGSDRWQFTIEPNAWIPQLSGSVTTSNGEGKVKLDLTDYISLIDELRMILMGRVTVQKGRFSIFYDGWYVKLKDETNGAVVSSEVTLRHLIEELGASYEIADWTIGGEAKKNLRLEILGGARHVYLRAEGSVAVPLLGVSLEADKTRQWVDPFIGGRLTLGLTDQTSVSLRGDIGGGASSDFIWNGELLLKHYFTKNNNWFATIGYRGMSTNYKDGSFKYQLDYYGPEMSMGFTF